MSDIYKKNTLNINLAFICLILASFTFLNLIFLKQISFSENTSISYESFLKDNLSSSQFNKNQLENLIVTENSLKNKFDNPSNKDDKLILFVLNLLFFVIVIYTIGSFTFSFKSIRSIEEKFLDQLEKNKELKNHIKEKSRYIRKRFKRKLIDLKNKKNVFTSSIRSFIDQHLFDKENDYSFMDDLKSIKTSLGANDIGIWSWDIKSDKVKIDKTCYKLLNLKQSIFAGGYSLFLNFFDKSSRRQLKKDIAYALKYQNSFETICTVKNISKRTLLLRGNVIKDDEKGIYTIKGVLMEKDCPVRSSEIQTNFLNQPIALFAILNQDFCFEFLNPAWVDQTGYSLHELKNYPLFNFIHQREKRLMLNNLHVLKQDNDKSVKNLKYRFRLSDGNFINIDFSISYENYRYYVLAHRISDIEDEEVSFSFQENWDSEYLKS